MVKKFFKRLALFFTNAYDWGGILRPARKLTVEEYQEEEQHLYDIENGISSENFTD